MINLSFRRAVPKAARILEVWERKTSNETRHVRIVHFTDDGAAYVEPAGNPPGEGRQSRIRLDRHGGLDGYRFLRDPATRLVCKSPLDAENCADYLHSKGCREVYVDGCEIGVTLPGADGVRRLAALAEERKWAEPADCEAIVAALD